MLTYFADVANTPAGLLYGLVALIALAASAAWCAIAPRPLSLGVLLTSAVVWPLTNGPLEGPVLWTLSADHGITVSDLLSVAAVALAAVEFRRMRHLRETAPAAEGPE
ncbi:hypothetical protein [Mycolicibacterium sediminis]|uniref:Uncharacterized protein n=1 Tax=Mycolicibacterium sediminis TaxID=1286180 RepID=A0A7I7QQH4_9MYCO|nr:hypothetical protein [Mycolicibacterium sediminis]BBY28633.1 hypothetical protein MSEDJ_27290 [Mycolicibacterium sediminis]